MGFLSFLLAQPIIIVAGSSELGTNNVTQCVEYIPTYNVHINIRRYLYLMHGECITYIITCVQIPTERYPHISQLRL